IVTTGVAFAVGGALPLVVMLPLALLAGFAGGAAFGAVPGALRARWGVNEIFVTVMLNFVAYYFTEWVATGPWNDPITGEAITPGYGAMAILIAVLGRMHPLGVGVASVLVAILMVGADSLQRSVKLPASAGAVFQAIVVLCVLLVEARSARRARA